MERLEKNNKMAEMPIKKLMLAMGGTNDYIYDTSGAL